MTDRVEGVSPLPFPTDKPTRKDFELWVGALQGISSPGLQLQNRLKIFVNNGVTDRKWWIYDGGTKIYYQYESDFEDVYDVYTGKFG